MVVRGENRWVFKILAPSLQSRVGPLCRRDGKTKVLAHPQAKALADPSLAGACAGK